jgi:MmyB-like transcription regulator ligand binding domain
LVGELSVRYQDFRRWWACHDVAHKTFGTKRFRHPIAGKLILDWQILACPHDPDQSIMVMTAEPSTTSHHALRFLASWTTEHTVSLNARETHPHGQ